MRKEKTGWHPVDIELMQMAYDHATGSPDKSNQNGAVVVDQHGDILKFGRNEYPRGFVAKPEHINRPRKYNFILHAEWQAVTGVHGTNLTLYCPWLACTICARSITESGVRRVVGHQQRMDTTPQRWKENVADGEYILDCAGIERLYIDRPLLIKPIFVNGEKWHGGVENVTEQEELAKQ